jgi:hypothetical protein
MGGAVTGRRRRNEWNARREIGRLEEEEKPKLLIFVICTKKRSKNLKGGKISAELFVNIFR